MVLQEKEKKLLFKIIAAGLLLVGVPYWLQDNASAVLREEQNNARELKRRVDELQQKLANVDSERELLLRYLDNYNVWQGRGAINEQDPVVWVKKMDQIKKRRRLFDVEFNFSEERQLNPSESLYTQGSTVSINFLEMGVDMPMLHDLDIFMFLENLGEEVDDLFFPVACTLTRTEGDFELSQRENMRGSCTVSWLSVMDPERGRQSADAAGG